MITPKKLFCSECGAEVFSASPEDESAGIMCLECSDGIPHDDDTYQAQIDRQKQWLESLRGETIDSDVIAVIARRIVFTVQQAQTITENAMEDK